MRPPSALIRLGKAITPREPEQKVVMRATALGQLKDPDIAHAKPATPVPLADALDEMRNMARFIISVLAIGTGDHNGIDPAPPLLGFLLVKTSTGLHTLRHPPETVFPSVNLKGIRGVRVTCWRRDKPKGGGANAP